LVAGTVRENLVMGRPISEESMLAAAQAARIHDFVMGLPQGYDTLLGEGGAKVSTGQRQLIAMARALAAQPQVLFLDEATANIDSGTEQVVQQALEALRGRVTILAIAHRLSTIRRADQILVLNHGLLVEQGQHEQLMAIEGGLYQRLVQLQDLSRMVEADEADAAVESLAADVAGSTLTGLASQPSQPPQST
jgi:ATP-binding cassette subfamily B protein/ATP-binding cassette subfamily C protein/ATP-binding cassette subfamily B multidrug efflux pump